VSYTVKDNGSVLELIEVASAETCAKFSKPGHGMQPGGGVFEWKPLKVNLDTAKQFFERHLAQTPARFASHVGAR
jgi:hypothetical protein